MRLIDADELRKKICREYHPADDIRFFDILHIISNAQTIEERPTGHWVISKDGTYPICSVCITRGETQYNGVEPIPKCTKYCSNCGARMESDV